MHIPTKSAVLKTIRQIHGLIGVVLFPLIFIAGFTGFYLNHANTLFGFLAATPLDETQFENWPDKQPASISSASELAATIWPGVKIERITSEPYHGRPSYRVFTPDRQLIVSKASGHYFIKSEFRRTTFAPDGTQLHSKIYWGYLFKWLHVRGWPNDLFGTLLTDISSIALILFSLSGAILWWMPKAKKIKRKLQQWQQTLLAKTKQNPDRLGRQPGL